jgi:16S rRNA processing protein RimM
MTPPATASPKRVALAAVAGAHGIKGEVRLKLFADTVASLKAHKQVFVGGEPRQLREVRDANKKTAIARLDGVHDRTAAEALRGQLVEVDRESLPPLPEGEYYHADLVGSPCVDEAGNVLGTVAEIVNFGAGDLIEVLLPNGKRSLIPFRDPIAVLGEDKLVLDPDYLA